MASYYDMDPVRKEHELDIFRRSADLAWAKLRRLEWDYNDLERKLKEAEERTECLRYYYMELLKKHGITDNG